VFLLNASVAFCLNIALILVVQYTSSLVLTLSGIVKDALLVILSVVMFATPVTILQVVGFSVSIGGINYYKNLREQINKEQAEKAKEQKEQEMIDEQEKGGAGATTAVGLGKVERVNQTSEDFIDEEIDVEGEPVNDAEAKVK